MPPNSSALEVDPSQQNSGENVEETKHILQKEPSKEESPADSPSKSIKEAVLEVDQKIIDTASYVGWQQISGWEEKDTLTPDDELLELNTETFLGNIIPDKFYGDWYHLLIVFGVAGFLSFVLGYFKFSLAPVFIIISICSIYIRTSAKKYRVAIRDLIEQELAVEKIEDDYESIEWLNSFMDNYWPRIEPTVSGDIVREVNKTLLDNPAIPKFIKSLWIDTFSLGIKAPRIDRVRTFPDTESDVVVMDWTLSFTPHDLSDLDDKRMKNYVNQIAVIKARLFGLIVPVSVSEISFKVDVRLKFQLMSKFPHIDTLNVQLLSVPDVDFVARLFGDSVFNWEILAIPGLFTLINAMAAKYLGPILLPPFSLQLNIPQLLSKSDLPIGVLEITIKSATGLKPTESIISNSTNPFIRFKLGNKIVNRTKTIEETLNPEWDEKLYILLGSFTEPLNISVMNQRKNFKDKAIGTLDFDLSMLRRENLQKNLIGKFLRNSKPVGELNFDLHFYTTIERNILADGSLEDSNDLNTGLSKISIDGCRGISDVINTKVTAFAELYINTKLVMSTKKCCQENALEWNAKHEFLVMNRLATRCKILLKDGKGKIIGSTIQSLNDLIDRQNIEKNWIPLKDSKAEVHISTFWKSVQLDVEANTLVYNPPIGLVRVLVNKAVGLRNKSANNPYVRILVNDITKDRTNIASYSKELIWNQALYVTVTSPNQKISLECMGVDDGHHTSLGKFDIPIQDLFDKDNDDKYIEQIDDSPRIGKLVNKKVSQAELTYYTSFFPTLPILSFDEIREVDNLKDKKKHIEQEKLAILEKGSMSSEDKKRINFEEAETKDKEEMFDNRMKLDLHELLQYNSGAIAISVLDGDLPQPGLYVQTFFDSSGYSRFTCPRVALRTIQTGWILDAMIPELEWSVTTFRVTKKRNSNKASDCLCEISVPTLELVKNCYNTPSIIVLSGSKTAKLTVRVAWFPTNVTKLPQADLITNSGDLTITAKSADSLIPLSPSGHSDPLLRFYLNDSEESFFETGHKKRTTDPIWNESTTTVIHNRVNDYLHIDVVEWDRYSTKNLIGQAIVPLAEVNPNEATSLNVPVETTNGIDGGILHLEFTFAPRYTLSVTKQVEKQNDIPILGIKTGIKAGTTVVNVGVGTLGIISSSFGGGKMASHNKIKKEEEAD